MKARKIRLIVTMFTLAAAITVITIPAEAQRRSSNERGKSEKVSTTKSRKSTPQTSRKSTTVKSTRSESKADSQRNYKRDDMNRAPRKVEQSDYRKSNQKKTEPVATRRSTDNRDNRVQNKTQNPENKGNVTRRSNETPDRERNPVRNTRNSGNDDNRSARILNNPDRRPDFDRDRPSRNYKGSDNYWTGNNHNDILRNNRNSRNARYWDRHWENYRWNNRSWRDYYGSYRPHAYLYNKYYFHHPKYGHVIRRFINKPVIFVYNHVPYYCYDGYFYNYRRGIGYILTDLAYNLIFPELPYGYETVYINGYVYFRVGNLFFEYVGNGYQLVYYPEMFLADRY
ncbi:MAG: hypothetical protein JXR31_16780 [Prolixibacteraceae bacterium]|nr:hypothetical protein [Prolixibacteraceae bacterium]MBN2775914.1 hypothetical protein [Prolixibacteraceae bacterium]